MATVRVFPRVRVKVFQKNRVPMQERLIKLFVNAKEEGGTLLDLGCRAVLSARGDNFVWA